MIILEVLHYPNQFSTHKVHMFIIIFFCCYSVVLKLPDKLYFSKKKEGHIIVFVANIILNH